MMEPKEISEWQHEEFYRYIAQAYDKPRYTLHYRADAPLNIRSIFYVPDMVRVPPLINLYACVCVCGGAGAGWCPGEWGRVFDSEPNGTGFDPQCVT